MNRPLLTNNRSPYGKPARMETSAISLGNTDLRAARGHAIIYVLGARRRLR